MREAIPVVIIAGGSGKRIGGGKPSHCLAGETLLSHAINKAQLYSQVFAVASGAEQVSICPGIRLLPDQQDIQGPIAGLHAAINFGIEIGAQYVMIMPCDTPFLPDNLLDILYAEIGVAMAALSQHAGRIHPACSLWHTDVFPLFPEYLAAGRRSLIGFAEFSGHVTAEIPAATAATIDPFFNINTGDDLAEAERILANLDAHKL